MPNSSLSIESWADGGTAKIKVNPAEDMVRHIEFSKCHFFSFRDYTWMHVWSAVVGSVAIPAWFFVPESPRWLACNKRVKEAEDIIMVRLLFCSNVQGDPSG